MKFFAICKQFCLESTFLGLKYFYLYPDRLSRCFWAVNMVAVMYLAFTLTYRINRRFIDMPTQTTIESQHERVSNLHYPTITICSPNQITQKFMNFISNEDIVSGSETNISFARDLLSFYEVIHSVDENQLIRLKSVLDRKNISTPELLGGIALSCDDFLIRCYFEMKRYECKELFSPILTPKGLCCAFNSQYSYDGKKNQFYPDTEFRNVQTTGEGRGLVIAGDYRPDQAVRGTILSGGSVKLMLSDVYEFPSGQDLWTVETETDTFLFLKAEVTTCSDEVLTLVPEHRKCFQEHEVDLTHFHTYSKGDCETTCVVETIEKECGCLMYYIANVTTRHVCNVTHTKCIMDIKRENKKMYECDCLADCESRQYSMDLVVGNLGAMEYYPINRFQDLKFNHSTFTMSFYFASPMYMKKKRETVMSLAILASNIGGVFGLCIGWSFLSLVELLFYLYKALKDYLIRRWQLSSVQVFEYRD